MSSRAIIQTSASHFGLRPSTPTTERLLSSAHQQNLYDFQFTRDTNLHVHCAVECRWNEASESGSEDWNWRTTCPGLAHGDQTVFSVCLNVSLCVWFKWVMVMVEYWQLGRDVMMGKAWANDDDDGAVASDVRPPPHPLLAQSRLGWEEIYPFLQPSIHP